MPNRDEPRNPKDKEKSDKLKEALPMMENIKDDIDSLKSNVVGLAKNIRSVSADRARVASAYVIDHVDDLKETGAATIGKVENRIKSRPGQSVAFAFAAGVLASFLLGRRSP